MIRWFRKEQQFYVTYTFDIRPSIKKPVMSSGDGHKTVTSKSCEIGKKEMREIRKIIIKELEEVIPWAKNKRVIINIKNIIKLPVK